MAVVPFLSLTGQLYRAVGLATGDETSILTCVAGQVEITVHCYGTVGGSTVTVRGSLLGAQFDTVDDAYGNAMSYTALGQVKPVGPAVSAVKVVVTGGVGVSIDVDVLILTKRV